MTAGRRLAPLVLAVVSAPAVAQEPVAVEGAEPPGRRPPRQEQEVSDFLGWPVAFAILLPIVIAAALAIKRGRNVQTFVRTFDDQNFEDEVLGSQMPVLVHFQRTWNVANRVALAQTELIAYMNRGAVVVGLFDIDQNPETMQRLPGFEPPAYLLFYRGRKLFHRPGIQAAEDLQKEIDVALSREGF